LRLIPYSEPFSNSFYEITTPNHNAFDHSGLFARAANAEQEKAFIEKYKTALEANDRATLQSVLYTTGADPMIVGSRAGQATKFPRSSW
jgi:hypothetical protein